MKYENSLCSKVSEELQISTAFEDSIFINTVVIGNGPSGISLSCLLSGNWPFYNGNNHPDPLLNARLKTCSAHMSLLLQDLEFLSQSMEGRCKNQLSNLVDALNHPNAELEIDQPSLLEYRYLPEKCVDHVIIGKGEPGGLWQNIDKDIKTLSFNKWMSLPGLPFEVWQNSGTKSKIERVRAGLVAHYYQDYVKIMKLSKYFRNNSQVIRIEPETEDSQIKWQVSGYDNEQKKAFTYKCRRVVLATGTADTPKVMDVPGEFDYLGKVFHCLTGFEKAVEELVCANKGAKNVQPVLIVGSGFSAFDAALHAKKHKIPILHQLRKNAISVERLLNRTHYPEYFELKEKGNQEETLYKQYLEYSLSEIYMLAGCLYVKLTSPEKQVSTHQVSLVAILIGSKADLGFLPASYMNGRLLAIDPSREINSKNNFIQINPTSYQVVKAHEDLYALGPLVGDNFVRCTLGGAVAIASHIAKTS